MLDEIQSKDYTNAIDISMIRSCGKEEVEDVDGVELTIEGVELSVEEKVEG